MRRGTRRRRRIVGWLAVAVIAAAGLALWLVAYTPPEEPGTVTRAQARHAQSAVQEFGQGLESVERDASAGKRRPFKVSLTQEDMTNFLRSDKTMGHLMSGRKLDKPKVEFDSDQITTSAYVTVHGRRLLVTVKGKLIQAAPGKLTFRSSSVKLGRFPAPAPLARKVDEAVNAYLSFGEITLPAQISKIETDDGALVLAGTSDPDRVRR